MDDIIGQIDDRRPGWRRRAGWIAAAVIAVALVAVGHLPHDAAPRPRYANAHGKVTVGGSPSAIAPGVQKPGVLPRKGISGKVPPWAASARLLRTGTTPAWFWPADGRVAPIRGLPHDRNGYVLTRVGGGWAIQLNASGPPGSSNCVDCPGPAGPVLYLPDRAARVTRVGIGDLVAPSAARGAIWLTSYPAAADQARTAGIAQQYTDAGIAVGPAVPLPVGYRVSQGTIRGLLLTPSSPAGQAISYREWDPAARRVLRSFRGVLAASATEVAYQPLCRAATCPVRVLNLSTGRTAAIKLPASNTVNAGRFSPDGRFLALEVSANNNAYGASAMRLEVAPMPHGHLVVVPHTGASTDALDGFGWPGDHDELAAEFSFIGQVQMVLWNQPAGQVAVADVSLRQDPSALVDG